MTFLESRALGREPLSHATVESFYDGSHSGTDRQCLRALCESHERLRAELEGAERLLELSQEEQAQAAMNALCRPPASATQTEWGVLGTSTEAFPDANGGNVTVTVALVRGTASDAACYAGVGPPNWVALNGTKVGLGYARRHFPGLERQLKAMGLWWRGPL